MALEVSNILDLVLAKVQPCETRLWQLAKILDLVVFKIDSLEELELLIG
jgi:hypothetical protein